MLLDRSYRLGLLVTVPRHVDILVCQTAREVSCPVDANRA
jgi:hypothetical protein